MAFGAMAQSTIYRGFVYEKNNEAPIPYANITFKGTKIGGSSGMDGFFQINNVPPGEYTVVVSFLGFKTIEKQIVIKKNRIRTDKFYMEEASQMLQDVVINVERQEMKRKIMTSVVTLSPKRLSVFL